MTPRLQLSRITKSYPTVIANDAISMSVAAGEIHAVLGENGAGKSTLMKIIYGAVRPDVGSIQWDGQAVNIRSPREARALGIAMVFQHFSLFDTLTVAENVALGLDRRTNLGVIAARIRAKAVEYGLDVDPHQTVHELSVGERQRVEIIRALLAEPKLLILDEPTSVLTPQAVDTLFAALRRLAATGCSILYISHKLDEIRVLCDNCTVLRAGRVVGMVNPKTETTASLARLMIGNDPPKVVHAPTKLGEIALAVKDLSRPGESGSALQNISLTVHAGEIVGIAGISGNGQQALLAALSGESPVAASAVELFGITIGHLGPAERRARRLHFVPEERLGRGAVPSLTLAENLLLTRANARTVGTGGWLNRDELGSMANNLIRRYQVKAGGPGALARSLSGGNLQKFIVGRELDAQPRVLVIAQPTWGVDIGATATIRAALIALRDAGCAVLVVSEDLDELLELTDRLYVIAKGRLSPAFATHDATVERIGAAMSGLWPGEGERAA